MAIGLGFLVLADFLVKKCSIDSLYSDQPAKSQTCERVVTTHTYLDELIVDNYFQEYIT